MTLSDKFEESCYVGTGESGEMFGLWNC